MVTARSIHYETRGPQTSPVPFSRMWRWPCLISWSISRSLPCCHSSQWRWSSSSLSRLLIQGQWLLILWHQVEWQTHPSGSEYFGPRSWALSQLRFSLPEGSSALQTVTIASALPFSVILLISIYGLLKALRRDLTKRESLSMATIAPTAARNPIPWQRRLRNIAYLPKRSLVKRFMDDVIHPRHDAGSGRAEQAGDDKPHQ